ncbi:hypothetical protein [Roseococcus suduntuyensis]|uniref:Uncharacterized protein n=1 Tax=Roseococcus suduntuyensis TaxID=455361 RepID=A0A840A869_9PROT|nr:hypothetical protein [Roseococcus suduntuyensis]MBB3897082.1 hypothetical protein [Roseococcus suduntuyensis]
MNPDTRNDTPIHQRQEMRGQAERPMVHHPEDFDDGLVHAHNYACGERGRPAH